MTSEIGSTSLHSHNTDTDDEACVDHREKALIDLDKSCKKGMSGASSKGNEDKDDQCWDSVQDDDLTQGKNFHHDDYVQSYQDDAGSGDRWDKARDN